jgi:prepilin-type N-terminal cleavage/methylation domain-containing protein
MKLQSSLKGRSGFTFIELIIVITVLGLLVAIAVPSYMRVRDNSRLTLIYTNLRTIEHAKTEWALDTHKTTGDPVANVATLSGYIRSGKINDALNESYVPNAVGTPAEADLPAGVALGPYSPGSAIPAP